MTGPQVILFDEQKTPVMLFAKYNKKIVQMQTPAPELILQILLFLARKKEIYND